MVQNIVVTTDQNLRSLLIDAVNLALDQRKPSIPVSSTKPLKVNEVCALTGYAASSIRNKVASREIPFHKRGGRVFFFEEEILAWIKEGSQKTKVEIEDESTETV